MAGFIKIFPVLLSTIGLSLVNVSESEIKEEIYEVNKYLAIKNLYFYNSDDYEDNDDCARIITFDINIKQFGILPNITANIPASDSNKCNTPTFTPDDRVLFKYQKVILKLQDAFLNFTAEHTVLSIRFGDTEIFSFKAPEKLIIDDYFKFNINTSIPKNNLIKRTVPLPTIKNNKIEYSFTETLDISELNLDKIINSYYGKFPSEHLWIKFYTNLYDDETKGLKELNITYPYSIRANVGIFGYELFKEYFSLTDDRWKNSAYETNYLVKNAEFNGYYQLEFNNTDRITLENGIMKFKSHVSDNFLKTVKNKPSKYVTYPLDLDDFDYNFERAKNMRFTIQIDAGLMSSFHLIFDYNFNLIKDFFYNHMNEYSLSGGFSNSELETIDIIYA